MTEPETSSVPIPSGEGTEPYAPAGSPTVHRYPPLPPGYRYVVPVPPPVASDGSPLAEAWQRFAAYVVDGAFTFLIMLPAIVIWAVIVFRRIRRLAERYQDQLDAGGGTPAPMHLFRHLIMLEAVGVAIVVPLGILVSYLYHVTFMHKSGQTPGKRFLKIKVVRAVDAAPMTTSIARKRWIAGILAPSFAPYFSYADALWLLWDKPYRQCLHDKCAETVVVKSTS
jgi:uncharacterized RDD family membrane protein YckC